MSLTGKLTEYYPSSLYDASYTLVRTMNLFSLTIMS